MEYYYKGKNFWLVNGNCLEVLADIPECSIDMVFADPPYMLSMVALLVNLGALFQLIREIGIKARELKLTLNFTRNGFPHASVY